MSDRRILYAAAFLRAAATAMLGVLLGIHLARLQLGATQVGMVIGAGLAGAALAALVMTLAGDRIGRRRSLIGLGVLGAVGATVVAVASRTEVLLIAACVGMLNGAGRDRGASVVLDQAILPGTTGDTGRTMGFAWYNVLQDVGHAIGSLLAATPVLFRHALHVDEVASLRLAIGIYALLSVATVGLYLRLSPAVEAPVPRAIHRLSPASRRVLWRISALFAVDSIAGGFLTASLLSYFFYERFHASEWAIAGLFFGARVANAGSHLAAASLARRIGLVNTMVFTHVPSSLLLATVPFAPSFGPAAVLFLVREGLVEMDVPTRQSYVMAMVQPHERTVASGVTNLVRLAGWAVAPAFAGMLMGSLSLATPLFIGAGMKVAYDALLYAAFKRQRPPEEIAP